MEKPLINFRHGINFLRYHYFFGDVYYFQLLTQICFLIVGMVTFIDWIPDKQFIYPLGWWLIALFLGFFILNLLIIQFFFTIPKRNLISISFCASILGCTLFSSLYLLFNSFSSLKSNIFQFWLAIFLLIGLILLYSLLEVRVGRINIFPDRIVISGGGKPTLKLFYREIQKVEWFDGPIESHLDDHIKAKNPEVLTPIELYCIGEDFEIHYFYAMIELKKKIYFLQPAAYRSALVQNIKNGWLETWRWDGTKIPPPEWKPSF